MEDLLVDSEILYSDEGGNVERWLEPRNKFFAFAIACVLLSIAFHYSYLCGYSSCILLLPSFHHFHYRFLLISIRRLLSTSTHNLEKLRGEVLEPFTENSTSILVLSDRFASFVISSF